MVTLLSSILLLELSFQDILAEMPRDAGALIVLLMFGIGAFFIWHGSRNQGANPPRVRKEDPAPTEESEEPLHPADR